ncbi:aminopeptidase P family protein [Alphaproteobacteria bacterium]|nr:aminopeptidase P family protein [Alphaproteobacteria bacterium]
MHNLQKIQNWMKDHSIDVLIINRTDEFLGEYIASYAERLLWISNFSGSSGKAIISKEQAYLFVDGRYTIQAHEQTDSKLFSVKHLQYYWKTLEDLCCEGKIIAIDSNLHSVEEVKKMQQIVDGKKSILQYLGINPIDKYWEKQPSYPQSKAFIHDLKNAGKARRDKIYDIQESLASTFIDYYILTSLDSIAWLLNIRGNDIDYTPLLCCFVIIPRKGKVELFIDEKKIRSIKNKLETFVNFHSFGSINEFIEKIGRGKIVGMDEKQTVYNFKKICLNSNITINYFSNPCTYPKAQKNEIELSGARNANIRDGASITKFLYWLKNIMKIDEANEINAADYLLNLRKENELFYSPSFDTISAFGPHSALPHYRVSPETNLSFENNSIYLVDSGAQYMDGTTDITRTVVFGEATDEQKDRFTRVLKGHIAIATAEFASNSVGSTLDPLARESLQAIGCDYDHGTGHGIGSFLSVHEGPQRIAKNQGLSDGIIYPGMILSNEPGYYKINEYGIRTENLIIACITKSNTMFFETISWAPIDRDLIEKSILLDSEINWINIYHQDVYNNVSPYLESQEKKWLAKVTKPL